MRLTYNIWVNRLKKMWRRTVLETVFFMEVKSTAKLITGTEIRSIILLNCELNHSKQINICEGNCSDEDLLTQRVRL